MSLQSRTGPHLARDALELCVLTILSDYGIVSGAELETQLRVAGVESTGYLPGVLAWLAERRFVEAHDIQDGLKHRTRHYRLAPDGAEQ